MTKKQAYIDKAQAKIDEQAARLDQLKAKAKGGVADKELEMHRQIDAMETKLKVTRSRLAQIADSADDAWEDMTERFEDLARDTGTSLRKFFGQ